jgi:hypothetical protein
MRLLLAALALAGAVTLAFAHDDGTGEGAWIGNQAERNPISNEWCCGEGDCFVIQKNLVHRMPGGFLVDVMDPAGNLHPEFVPDAEISPSVDTQYWRCRKPDGSRRCFFAPPGPDT